MTITECYANPTDSSVTKQMIRVVTYNIRAGIGMDGCYDLRRVSAALATYDADVIGLQEVDVCWGERSDWDNQVVELADRLQMHSFFAPIYALDPSGPGKAGRYYGLAILSRYPFTRMTNHMMTRLSTQVAKPVPAPAPGFADVEIDANGVSLRVMNVQLDYRPDPTVRKMQAGEILSATASLQVPAVLVGDFNALPGAPELAPLAEVWIDAWRVRGDGPGATFPADTPTRRIDWIMVSPGIDVEDISVESTLASDHRPVVVDLIV